MHRSRFLILFYRKRNKCSTEKLLILELGQEICKMSLKHLIMPENKEVLKKQTNKNISRAMTKVIYRGGEQEELPVAKPGTI